MLHLFCSCQIPKCLKCLLFLISNSKKMVRPGWLFIRSKHVFGLTKDLHVDKKYLQALFVLTSSLKQRSEYQLLVTCDPWPASCDSWPVPRNPWSVTRYPLPVTRYPLPVTCGLDSPPPLKPRAPDETGVLMYQSIEASTPPQAIPGHLNFWKIFVQIPPPGRKAVQMPPTTGKLPDYCFNFPVASIMLLKLCT